MKNVLRSERINRFLRCLHEGRIPFGTLVALNDPAIIEIVAYAGYDFVILDMEHGPADLRSIENMVRAAEVGGITPLVRVGDLSPNWIIRSLETGAQGVVIPHLSSTAQAQVAVRSSFFYPIGERGICRATRAAAYSATPVADHIAGSNNNIIVMGLIEDASAVEAIGKIVSVHGLTAIMPGPVDLSQSLGFGGRTDLPELEEILAGIFSVANAKSCAAGAYVTEPPQADKFLKLGAKFIVYNMPARVLLQGYQNALAQMREIAYVS